MSMKTKRRLFLWHKKLTFINLMLQTRLLIVLTVLTLCWCQCCNETECAGYCICGINKCATQILPTGTNFTITQAPSYYYFEPEFDTYATIEIVLCGTPATDYMNVLYAKVEQEEGDYPHEGNTKRVEFLPQAYCSEFYGTGLKFEKLPNNNRKKLLLSLSTSKPASEQMIGYIVAQQSILSNLVMTLFATVVSIIVLLLLGVPIMYIRRRCLSKKRLNEAQDVNHIDKYMPCKMLGDSDQPGNCSVCLSDILKGEEFRTTPCNHMFHKLCIDDWCKKAMSCPNCRHDLSKKTLKEKTKKPRRSWFGNNLQNVLVEEATSV